MITAKRYTTKELKAIDEVLDLGDTGASQKPGWYWQEVDDAGEIETGPCGPYKSEKAALANAARFNKRSAA
jgi:hypothetical protein